MSKHTSRRATLVAAAIAITATTTSVAWLTIDNHDASAKPAKHTPPAVDITPYSVLPDIAAWARANGYSGLSPASLTPPAVDITPYSVLPDIAAWARANGYSGLSPASLTPAHS